LALNYVTGIFLESLSYLYEVVRTNFTANFCTYGNFDRNFSKIVAPPNDGNENYVVHLIEQPAPSEKTV